MASIDEVYRNTDMLLDALIRSPPDGITPFLGNTRGFPGLVPSIYRAARTASDTSAEILKVVNAISDLLNSVDSETLSRIESTLSRIETLLNAVNTEPLGRIEALLNAVNTETLGRIESRINGNEQTLVQVERQIKQATTDLNAKLDTLKADIQGLPH